MVIFAAILTTFWLQVMHRDQGLPKDYKHSKPCPFDLGLRKFAVDFVVGIIFKNAKKIYMWWFDYVLRKILA